MNKDANQTAMPSDWPDCPHCGALTFYPSGRCMQRCQERQAQSDTADRSPPMTAAEFCRLAVSSFYEDKPDDYRLSLGHWDTPEPDSAKMTIYTMPRFEADMSVTVGELRRMAGVTNAG